MNATLWRIVAILSPAARRARYLETSEMGVRYGMTASERWAHAAQVVRTEAHKATAMRAAAWMRDGIGSHQFASVRVERGAR